MSVTCVTNGDLDACHEGEVTGEVFRALWKAKALGSTKGSLSVLRALATELETGGINDWASSTIDRRYASWLRDRADNIERDASRDSEPKPLSRDVQ